VPAPRTDPYTQEVADGVLAYIQPAGGWCVSNAGIVAAGAETMLIDTAATQARAMRLTAAVRAAGAWPPRLIVNTHHHGDHTFGNAAFPAATVVGHETTREDMLTRGAALRAVWPDVDWGELDIVPPTVTFTDRLTVYAGGRPVELRHVGPAHTTGDVVAWLPAERVLFAGDVVMAGRAPFVLMGAVAGSIAAIRELRALGPRTVVCGHGPVTGPDTLDVAEAYLVWLQGVAAEGIAAGLSPLEAARHADLGPFKELAETERLVANLHRAYREQRAGDAPGTGAGDAPGTRIPSAPVFAEMVAYNGGRPLACHA
jgi:cyclase